MEEKIVT